MRFRTASSGKQDLERCDAPDTVGGRQERLRDDSLERVRDHDAHLLLLLRCKDVDDAVDRRRRALRVQGAEDEVPGLRSGERGGDRLEVAHLADEDHVGVLAERAFNASAKLDASGPISRWLTMHFLWRCTNSIGSSTVRMCSARVG
jgi:hypothetical protein